MKNKNKRWGGEGQGKTRMRVPASVRMKEVPSKRRGRREQEGGKKEKAGGIGSEKLEASGKLHNTSASLPRLCLPNIYSRGRREG